MRYEVESNKTGRTAVGGVRALDRVGSTNMWERLQILEGAVALGYQAVVSIRA